MTRTRLQLPGYRVNVDDQYVVHEGAGAYLVHVAQLDLVIDLHGPMVEDEEGSGAHYDQFLHKLEREWNE